MPAVGAAPKEKKAAATAAKPKPKPSAPSHPPYFQMIKEAIEALHERTGSSAQAIAKHAEEKHKGALPPNFKKMLALQLRNSASRGKLVKVKASFKLAEAGRKESKPVPAKKKKASAAEPKKKAPPKASTKPKKAAPVKPRQPKSIKSSAAKKARRTVAA